MACSKIFSGDIPEIIDYILQYLRNDLRSLYSYIFVNRLFCRISIPLLWEDPFSIPLSNKTFIHFLDIYFLYLSDVNKNTLKNHGFNMIDSLSLKPHLFNYPSFLKTVNSSLIDSHLMVWMNKSRILSNELKASSHINTCTINCPLTEIQYKASNKTNMENFRNFIYKKADTTLILKINLAYFLLFEIFIKNDASLYKLQLEDRFFSTKNFYNLDELILETPKFISRVKDFRIIISCPEFEAIRKLQNFLSSLPLICNSIKYIELNFPHEVHNKFLQEIKNLFKSQITLSKVLFNRICSLTESLKYCSNTLTSISFHFIIFNENIPELFIQSLLNISIPLKIKTLILDDNVIQSSFPFQLLFHNIGPYLKYLVIIYQPYFIEDFYEFIIQYCEKIEFLYLTEIINNYENLFFQIMELFNNNLRYLTLEVKGKLGKNFLKELGQSLPINLEYLDLYFDLDPINLTHFFENLVKNNLKATLYVIKEFVKGKNLEYLTYAITNQFVLSNNLKNLIKETENIVKMKMYDDLIIRPSDIDGLI
ncbi:hypothetical protein RhiirC2_848199 [Rhizophagus irregularis]|uniref:F-box domain-containing protein n=1 Tax=Rhizophagus irregularis TaxID=588596 RepID=A0A2N1NFR8_9GLOM|nr:hypothetical protein RhiirC2_848199 [Rhizophagus irregularis]